jgi:RimJ/RimL family protein N-acetyltransferase
MGCMRYYKNLTVNPFFEFGPSPSECAASQCVPRYSDYPLRIFHWAAMASLEPLLGCALRRQFIRSGTYPPTMIQLEPMTPEEFRASVERAIPRRAANNVRWGVWSEAGALEASRLEFADRLQTGPEDPGHHYCKVLTPSEPSAIGETWYLTRLEGGKPQFWVDWLWIEPPFRRRGFASQVLGELCDRASGLGGDRIGLSVYSDNPGAIALYAKLGFAPIDTHLSKPLTPTR